MLYAFAAKSVTFYIKESIKNAYIHFRKPLSSSSSGVLPEAQPQVGEAATSSVDFSKGWPHLSL